MRHLGPRTQPEDAAAAGKSLAGMPSGGWAGQSTGASGAGPHGGAGSPPWVAPLPIPPALIKRCRRKLGSGWPPVGGGALEAAASARAARAARAAGRRGGGHDVPVSDGKPTIYLAGDSTVQPCASQAPQQGWGQRIQEFFTNDVSIVNKAIGGRSSKSFIDEGRLVEIEKLLKKGDYLFCQWGINDRYMSDPARYTNPATTFRDYLKQYIAAARGKNAIPVLVTPTPRLNYVNGAFMNDFPAYCDAIAAVGAETHTPVIDLQTKALAYYTSVGFEVVERDIALDVLHFKEKGALEWRGWWQRARESLRCRSRLCQMKPVIDSARRILPALAFARGSRQVAARQRRTAEPQHGRDRPGLELARPPRAAPRASGRPGHGSPDQRRRFGRGVSMVAAPRPSGASGASAGSAMAQGGAGRRRQQRRRKCRRRRSGGSSDGTKRSKSGSPATPRFSMQWGVPCGWGSRFAPLFKEQVTVVNRAVGGRSIQTWLYEAAVTTSLGSDGECTLSSQSYDKRWRDMLDATSGMQAGDYLFIQFGINDGDRTCPRHVGLSAFKTYLGVMAQAAEERGAQAVFVTPASAIACNGSKATKTRGAFVDETLAAARASGVPVIDLHQLSIGLYDSLGFCPNDDDYGKGALGAFFCSDHTHFEAAGAEQIAELVGQAIKIQSLSLAAHLR